MLEFQSDWVGPEEACKWDKSSIVLILRPNRKKGEHGYLELTQYFRPDWVKEKHYYENAGEITLFRLLK